MINLFKRIYFSQKKVVYNERFFQKEWFTNWEELKVVLSELIHTMPNCSSVFDFGCGPGIMIDYMNDLGVYYTGCDYSKDARELYLKHYGKYPFQYVQHLNDIKGKKYDLFLCFDVFEHMNNEEIVQLLGTTTAFSTFLLNISREKYIPGHINIKSDSQWIHFLEQYGLSYQVTLTDTMRSKYKTLRSDAQDKLDQNMFVFLRL